MTKLVLFVLIVFWISPFSRADGVVADGMSIELFGGASMMSSKLEGKGFAGELPSTSGTNYGAILSRGWAKQGIRTNLRYRRASVGFDGPSTVTPNRIGATRNEYSLLVLFNPTGESSFSSFHYGMGYNLVQYSVDRNTPAILTDQTSHGFSILVGKDFRWSDKWSSSADFTLYAPNNLSEGATPSGFNGRFLGLELELQIVYKLQEDFALYLGGDYRHEQASFTGTGARGTTGAKDIRTIISFPVGMRWDFF